MTEEFGNNCFVVILREAKFYILMLIQRTAEEVSPLFQIKGMAT